MKLAVCLITADRPDYTKRALESFTRFNAQHRLILLHADDGSGDDANHRLAFNYGFMSLVRSPMGKRRGGQAMRREIIDHAARNGATHVMILENDIETARPLPLEFLEHCFQISTVYCVRLYGLYKERGERRACGTTHYGKGKGKYNPGWVKFHNPQGEPAEIGDIHWGAQPCVTSIKEAVWLHNDTTTESQIRKKCAQLTKLTVRTMTNVCYHMGEVRTPEFRA